MRIKGLCAPEWLLSSQHRRLVKLLVCLNGLCRGSVSAPVHRNKRDGTRTRRRRKLTQTHTHYCVLHRRLFQRTRFNCVCLSGLVKWLRFLGFVCRTVRSIRCHLDRIVKSLFMVIDRTILYRSVVNLDEVC